MLDACAGGVVTTGEEMERSARRELAEELGIMDVPLQGFGSFYAEGEGYRVWGGLFSCRYQGPLQLQAEEVSAVHWMSLAEIAERASEFTPTPCLPSPPGRQGADQLHIFSSPETRRAA